MNFWMTLESVQAFAKVSSQMFAEASAAHREDVAERAARMEPDPRGGKTACQKLAESIIPSLQFDWSRAIASFSCEQGLVKCAVASLCARCNLEARWPCDLMNPLFMHQCL